MINYVSGHLHKERVKMNKRLRLSKEERKNQILESALKTFVRSGYSGTTTLEIAKDANISEVTLFRYFNTKEEIFKSAIEPLILKSFEDVIEVSSTLKPFDKFKVVLKDRIKFVNEFSSVIKLVLMESEINPIITDYNFVGKITDLIESTVKDSGLIIKDYSFVIRIIRGTMLSYLYDNEISEEKIDLHITRLIEMLTASEAMIEKEGFNE